MPRCEGAFSMSELTQDQRLLSISSPLGKDVLLLTSFEGTEYISDLFEFNIEVLSSNHEIKPDQLIGKTVTITLQNDQNRTFNGYISRFTYGEVKADNLRAYQLTMVPWLWFLSKTNNHRIFQEKTTKDIITEVFKDLGFNDFDYKATGNSTKREYCVQHNESDLNFISRLLEEDGIAYYFEQNGDKHIMHIVDALNAYKQCAETDRTYSKGNQPETQVNRWEHVYEFRTGKWSIDDFDFNNPTKENLQTKTSTSKFSNVEKYEHYEYTPYYDVSGISELSKKRIEAEETPMNIIEASSDCSSFYAGGYFNLKKHAIASEQGKYIITAIRHRAFDNSYLAGNESSSGYGNDFACIPDSVHFRPPQIHHKPLMSGPQSALVVGSSGEEIYVDEQGRIKVQFHWDRNGKKNEKSSCYIRVVQPWAGSGWGTSFIPRIGMEVIVNFFDGDPDRPIITGAVYNGDNKPPYSSKTQSGIKTKSSKKGDGWNELRFDDLKGSEEIYIQAEKDLNSLIKNDHQLTVKNNQSYTVEKEQSITVKDKRTLKVTNDDTTNANKIVIKGDSSIELKVGGSSIKIEPAGIKIKATKIEINGTMVDVKGSGIVGIKGGLTKIN